MQQAKAWGKAAFLFSAHSGKEATSADSLFVAVSGVQCFPYFSLKADRFALAHISVAAVQRLAGHRVSLRHVSVEVGDSLARRDTG